MSDAPGAGADRAPSHSNAEVDELVHALQNYGCLTRHRLAEIAGARHWSDHAFAAALRHGVEQGRIRKLSEDLYEIAEDHAA